MYGSGSAPAPGEVGSGMKAFFLLVLMFFGFIFLASSGISNVDLTPDTPAVNAESVPVTSGGAADDVIVIQNGAPAAASPVYQVPVTGTCTNPYVVRPGDTLSSIAVLCDTSFASIRLANPEITNANMIYPGQSIRIPVEGAVIQPTAIPVTGSEPFQKDVVVPNTSSPTVITTAPSAQPTAAPGISALPPGALVIQPGTGMQVTGINFPPNTSVYVAIGPLNTGYNVVANLMTDASGTVHTNIIVPPAPNPDDSWVVVVATTTTPVIQAASTAFYIR